MAFILALAWARSWKRMLPYKGPEPWPQGSAESPFGPHGQPGPWEMCLSWVPSEVCPRGWGVWTQAEGPRPP